MLDETNFHLIEVEHSVEFVKELLADDPLFTKCSFSKEKVWDWVRSTNSDEIVTLQNEFVDLITVGRFLEIDLKRWEIGALSIYAALINK